METFMFVNISAFAGLVNLILVLIVTILPQWRINSPVASQPSFNYLRVTEGLWIRCSGYPNQYFTCDQYGSSIIGLAAYLNAFRAFMIISIILTIIGVVCSVLGMRCTTMLEEGGRGRRWAIISGGVCHIASGAFTGISVSWYAAEVVRDYYDPINHSDSIKYTLGACLYVGWISMVFSLACGCLMVCCTCFNKPPDHSSYAYTYNGNNVHEKHAVPPSYTGYKTEPYYKEKSSYHREPDYHGSRSHRSGRDHRSHRSRDKRSYHGSSHKSHRRSSSSDSSNYNSSRHHSDIIRASGFV